MLHSILEPNRHSALVKYVAFCFFLISFSGVVIPDTNNRGLSNTPDMEGDDSAMTHPNDHGLSGFYPFDCEPTHLINDPDKAHTSA